MESTPYVPQNLDLNSFGFGIRGFGISLLNLLILKLCDPQEEAKMFAFSRTIYAETSEA